MRQFVEFYYSSIPARSYLLNKLYAWSRKHNIVFMETHTEIKLRIHFGREQELTVFILTWPHTDIAYTVL